MPCTLEKPMSHYREKFPQKQEPKMPAVEEARTMLCAIPLDLARNETRAAWLRRSSGELGIPPALGERIYYREKKRMDADWLDAMRARFSSLQRRTQNLRGKVDEIERILNASREEEGDPAASGRVPGVHAASRTGRRTRRRATA